MKHGLTVMISTPNANLFNGSVLNFQFLQLEESATGNSNVGNVKMMLSVFSTSTAFAHREYGPSGRTINQAYYSTVLRHQLDVELCR